MPAYSYKRRFVAPILLGLGIEPTPEVRAIWDAQGKVIRPKRQTIRAVGKRRHARPGEIIQHYHGMRTKQCFKIGDGRCTEACKITITFDHPAIEIRSRTNVTQSFLSDPTSLDGFARQDGFADWNEMLVFWDEEHGLGKFEGVLIKWEPLS